MTKNPKEPKKSSGEELKSSEKELKTHTLTLQTESGELICEIEYEEREWSIIEAAARFKNQTIEEFILEALKNEFRRD